LLYRDITLARSRTRTLAGHLAKQALLSLYPGTLTRRLALRKDKYTAVRDPEFDLSVLLSFFPNLRILDGIHSGVKAEITFIAQSFQGLTVLLLTVNMSQDDSVHSLGHLAGLSALKRLYLCFIHTDPTHTSSAIIEGMPGLGLNKLAHLTWFAAFEATAAYSSLTAFLSRCAFLQLTYLSWGADVSVIDIPEVASSMQTFFDAHPQPIHLTISGLPSVTKAILELRSTIQTIHLLERAPLGITRLPKSLRAVELDGTDRAVECNFLDVLLDSPHILGSLQAIRIRIDPSAPTAAAFRWKDAMSMVRNQRRDQLAHVRDHFFGKMLAYALRFHALGVSLVDDDNKVSPLASTHRTCCARIIVSKVAEGTSVSQDGPNVIWSA
jgi:hypothetical protein